MADNVLIDPGATTSIATDEIGGIHYQRAKQALGRDGVWTADLAGRDLGSGDGAAYVDPRLKRVRLQVTPVISTVAYTAKDNVGGLMTFANAARVAGGSICIEGVEIIDKAQQMKAIDLIFFDRTITAPTDNAIFDPTDTELGFRLGRVSFYATDFDDYSDNSAASRFGLGLTGVLNGSDLFAVAAAREAATYVGTSDLVVTVTVLQD